MIRTSARVEHGTDRTASGRTARAIALANNDKALLPQLLKQLERVCLDHRRVGFVLLREYLCDLSDRSVPLAELPDPTADVIERKVLAVIRIQHDDAVVSPRRHTIPSPR